MTAQVLASELANIVQDSKRKHPDIRAAAEKSLSELKALPNTSESQLASDLKRRPHFVKPFLLSCNSKTPKLIISSIACLQRLVVSNGLANENLKEVLDGLRECTSLAQDVQLRTLQVLPSLLQNYGKLVTGELLATALQLCFMLLASRAAVISNTAAATLQQLVVSVFDRVVQEDEAPEETFVEDVPIEDGEKSVGRAALDAYRLLNDLCLLVEGQKPLFLQPISLPPNFGLELIESILVNHAEVVTAHPEQIHVLRLKLLPFTIRALSDRLPYSTTVRAMRLLPIIFSNLLSVLSTECEMVLGLLNHMLEPDASVLWKRVLCMEVLKGIHAEPNLVRSMYMRFDEQEGRRNIIQDQMAVMVHLASEKPAIIGLGQQSTAPESSGQDEDGMDEMAALQAEGISGTIGVAMSIRSSTAPGISVRLSTMRVACLEQLDKSEPPLIPPSYLYSLDLTCMNSFSEGLARFLLPFTVPNDTKSKSRKRAGTKDGGNTRSAERDDGTMPKDSRERPSPSRTPTSHALKLPINPLTLENHVLFDQIRTSYRMVESCWPALLAGYSTFFHAALDSEYYRALVRSFQKFTQISGLLRLSTPRDAFLTTLGKNAVPSGSTSLSNSEMGLMSPTREKASFSDADQIVSEKIRVSSELPRATLNARNLLCLRALLNLGIALGPVLDSAWTIILEQLQQADFVITYISSQRRQSRVQDATGNTGGSVFSGEIGNEIAAVNAAATRMFESTNDLPDAAYLDVITSLCGLFRDLREVHEPPSNGDTGSARPKIHHRKKSSLAGSIVGQTHDPRLNIFVLNQISKVLEYNKFRFLENTTDENGWSILTQALRNVVQTRQIDVNVRLQACKVLTQLVIMTASGEVFEEIQEDARLQGLLELRKQIDGLQIEGEEVISASKTKAVKSCEGEIHWMSLETLRAVLEQYGDSLSVGWEHVFAIVTSVFEGGSPGTGSSEIEAAPHTKSPKLLRSSFGSMQLICSDFLGSLPESRLSVLLHAVHAFCSQQEDLNISLISTTLYCNVADHLCLGETELNLGAADEEAPEDSHDPASRLAKPAMFLRLLLLLAESTADQRLEIRHGAVHSIFRILDTCNEKISPEDWISCHQKILLTLFPRNEAAYKEACKEESEGQLALASGWNETATILLDNISTIFALQLEGMLKQSEFTSIWEKLLDQFSQLLSRHSLVVSGAVFTALEKILSEVEEAKPQFGDHALRAWRVWLAGNPATHKESSRRTPDNQAALLAYLQCFAELYPLLTDKICLADVKAIIEQIHACIRMSSPTSYAGDVKSMTGVQEQAVKCISHIRADVEGSAAELLRGLASLVTFAFDHINASSEHKGPTFVALSKAAIDLVDKYVEKHKRSREIFRSDCLPFVLRCLCKAIHSKHHWDVEDPEPPTWRKATEATVHVLQATLPALKDMEISKKDQSQIWEEVLASCSEIISADIVSEMTNEGLPGDEDLDVKSFLQTYDLLVPTLGSAAVSGELRRSFANSLLRNSYVHEPHPDDLPAPDQEPLEALESTHIGRTNTLAPSRRTRMAYTVLDKLFDLVAAHDDSPPERVRLAQAAAPYLILRVGVTLKAYVLDQPLRGRMPQPSSQRRELLHILRLLLELDCEPKAIPDAPGVVSRHKKHLYRVYGLVVKALAVARRDEEVHAALTRVVDAVSMDFGV